MPDFDMLFKEAKEFDLKGLDMALKDFVDFDFKEELGACLKSKDALGRRILFIVGTDHNLVVFDRYPDLEMTIFKFYAIPAVTIKLPPVLYRADFDKLFDYASVSRRNFRT